MAEKFIQKQNFNLAKSIPALVGINLDGVKPYQGYGNAIMQAVEYTEKLLEKSQQIKDNNVINNLKSQWDDLDNEFNQNVLTDPNVYNTKDGRASVVSLYNDIIEKKLASLNNTDAPLNKRQRAELQDYLKKTTQSKIFTMQKDLNNGMIKETVDDVTLSTEKAIARIVNYDNTEQQDEVVAETLNNIKMLEELGIKTDKMQLTFLTKTQDAITDKLIDENIINNRTNPKFFETTDGGEVRYDENGNELNVVRDAMGNPLIDPKKQLKAIYDVVDNELSDKECKRIAKELNQKTGINEEEAFYYIKNARKEKWIKSSAGFTAKLQQQEYYNTQAKIKLGEQINNKIQKDISSFNNYKKDGNINGMLNMISEYSYTNPIPISYLANDNGIMKNGVPISNFEVLYGTTFDDMVNGNQYYAKMLNTGIASNLGKMITKGENGGLDMNSLGRFIATANSQFVDQSSGKTYTDNQINMMIDEISDNMNLPIAKHSEFIKSLLGRNDTDSSLLTQNDAINILNATMLAKDPKMSIETYQDKYDGSKDLFLNSSDVGAFEVNDIMYKYMMVYGKNYSRKFQNLDPNDPSSIGRLNSLYKSLKPNEKEMVKNIRSKIQNTVIKQNRIPAPVTNESYNVIQRNAEITTKNLQAGTAYKKDVEGLKKSQAEGVVGKGSYVVEGGVDKVLPTQNNNFWIESLVKNRRLLKASDFNDELNKRWKTLSDKEKRTLHRIVPIGSSSRKYMID